MGTGTWNIKVSSFRDTTGTDRIGEYLLDDGDLKTIDASTNNTGTHCAEWTGVASGSHTVKMVVESGSTYAYLNSIVITKIT